MMKHVLNDNKRKILVVILVICLLSTSMVFASNATDPIIAKGETVVQEGNVVVEESGITAIKATKGANVTVNGDVTSGVRNNAINPGIDATKSTVTVNGNVTTNGIKESAGVTAHNKTKVTVTGNVTTTGSDDNNDGVIANWGAVAKVGGDITTRGYKSSGIAADMASTQVTAKDITNNGDAGWGVRASDGATVDVKNIVIDNVTDGGGVNAGVNAIVTADNVTTRGSQAVGVNVNNMGAGGSVTIDGSVLSTGKDAVGAALYFDGKLRVGGDVSATQGYGAVIYLIPKDAPDKGAPTIVVEGTLSGEKAPIAIMPLIYDKSRWGYKFNENFDVSDYELPTIIVSNMEKGDGVHVVNEDDDDNLIVVHSAAAEAFGDAVLKNVNYIMEGGETKTVDIGGRTYNYPVAREADRN